MTQVNIDESPIAQAEVAKLQKDTAKPDTDLASQATKAAEPDMEAAIDENPEVTTDAEGTDVMGALATGKVEKATELAPKKEQASLSAEQLTELKNEIEAGLETGLLDWNVEEDRVIEALLKVPAHQMEAFAKQIEGVNSVVDLKQKLSDSGAFNYDEMDLISAKLSNNTDLLAASLKDQMTDNSVMDGSNPEHAILLMKGLSDEKLKEVLSEIDTKVLKDAIGSEFNYTSERIPAYAELIRGGIDAHKEVATMAFYKLNYLKGDAQKQLIDTLKGMDKEKLFAANDKLKEKLLVTAAKSPQIREDVFNMLYGAERANALIAVGKAFDKPENVGDFLKAYKSLSPEQQKQFQTDFAETYGKEHGSDFELALSNSVEKDKKAWVALMNGMDNGLEFDSEYVEGLSDKDFKALVEETRGERVLEKARAKNKEPEAATEAETAKEAEIKAEVEKEAEVEKKIEYNLNQAEKESVKTYCKAFRVNPERLRDQDLKELLVYFIDGAQKGDSQYEKLNEALSKYSDEQKAAFIDKASKWTPEQGEGHAVKIRAQYQLRIKEAFISTLEQSRSAKKAA